MCVFFLLFIGLLRGKRDRRRHENGMKNGNRFEQPSRCKGGRHNDNRSATKRKTRRRGARRRWCFGPQYSGLGPPIGDHRDPHLGIFHQSWRWVMLLKFFSTGRALFPCFDARWCALSIVHRIAHARNILAVKLPTLEFTVAISIAYRFVSFVRVKLKIGTSNRTRARRLTNKFALW